MALILSMQGNARFLIWKTGWDAYTMAYLPTFGALPQDFHNSTSYAKQLGENLTVFSAYFRSQELITFYNYQPNLTYISHLDFNTTGGQNNASQLVQSISYEAILYMFNVLNIEIPESSQHEGILALYLAALNVFRVVTYTYYIAGSAAVLILLGLMFCFGKRNKSRYEWVSIALRIVAGIALGLVLLTLLRGGQAGSNIVQANWTIPIVLLIYAVGTFSGSLASAPVLRLGLKERTTDGLLY